MFSRAIKWLFRCLLQDHHEWWYELEANDGRIPGRHTMWVKYTDMYSYEPEYLLSGRRVCVICNKRDGEHYAGKLDGWYR